MVTGVVAEKKRALERKQVQGIAANAENMARNDLFRGVCRQDGNGYCMEYCTVSVHVSKCLGLDDCIES